MDNEFSNLRSDIRKLIDKSNTDLEKRITKLIERYEKRIVKLASKTNKTTNTKRAPKKAPPKKYSGRRTDSKVQSDSEESYYTSSEDDE